MSLYVKIVKRLSKNFLLDIEYETGGEDCLGILGASGSGKSMSLKCIAGIEKPDAGLIVVDGRVLFDSEHKINIKPRERRIGYLFQNYALFPTMTLLENISAPLARPKKQKRELARYWITKFGLEGMEERRPSELSGGQQQRAALARMLVCRPRAVLLDEPFSALDVTLREYMQLEFSALLKKDGEDSLRNAVVVTHSRDEVFCLCPKLAIIDNGKIVIKGSTQAIFNNPRSVKAAVITGCKNISRIKRINDYMIYAVDWDLPLHTLEIVNSAVTHVGIRAHTITDCYDAAVTYNTIAVKVKELVSDPFETTLVFTNAEASSQTAIWRQYPNEKNKTLPDKLFFPPENLLLLRE